MRALDAHYNHLNTSLFFKNEKDFMLPSMSVPTQSPVFERSVFMQCKHLLCGRGPCGRQQHG